MRVDHARRPRRRRRRSRTPPIFFGSPKVSRPPIVACSVVIGMNSGYSPSMPSVRGRARRTSPRRTPGCPCPCRPSRIGCARAAPTVRAAAAAPAAITSGSVSQIAVTAVDQISPCSPRPRGCAVLRPDVRRTGPAPCLPLGFPLELAVSHRYSNGVTGSVVNRLSRGNRGERGRSARQGRRRHGRRERHRAGDGAAVRARGHDGRRGRRPRGRSRRRDGEAPRRRPRRPSTAQSST